MELRVTLNLGTRGYFPSHLKLRGSQEGCLLRGTPTGKQGAGAVEQLSNQGAIACGWSDLDKSHISQPSPEGRAERWFAHAQNL